MANLVKMPNMAKFATGLVNIQIGYQKRPLESGENSENLSVMVK